VQLVLYYTNHKDLGNDSSDRGVFCAHDTMIGSPLRREGYEKLILKGSHRTVGVMQRQRRGKYFVREREGQGSRVSVS
jgi:hypothetical protein